MEQFYLTAILVLVYIVDKVHSMKHISTLNKKNEELMDKIVAKNMHEVIQKKIVDANTEMINKIKPESKKTMDNLDEPLGKNEMVG